MPAADFEPEEPEMPEEDEEPVLRPQRPISPRFAQARRNPPLKLKRSKAWPALILLSGGLLIFLFIAWQYLDDVKDVVDDDLRPHRAMDQTPQISLPRKFSVLLSSAMPLNASAAASTPPWLWETPTLARFVQSNRAALDNLRDLLEEADWHPAHSAWHAKDLGSDAAWRTLFLAKQAEAAYVARLGRKEEAFAAAIDLTELAWRLELIWAWPSFYSRALEAHELAAQTLAELLQNPRLPELLLRQYQRQYTAYQPARETLAEALGAFYFHEKKLLLGAESHEPADTMPGGAQLPRPGRFFFKPRTTVQLFAEQMRQLQMEARAPVANIGLVTVDERAQLRPQGWQPNAAGQSYFASRIAGYRALPAQFGLARARCSLIITLFAFHRYVAEKKTPPATLDQLRGQYVLDIPIDPFSANPVLYDKNRGWLWSVGTDLKSQGGLPTSPPMRDEREPTVETGIRIAVEASK